MLLTLYSKWYDSRRLTSGLVDKGDRGDNVDRGDRGDNADRGDRGDRVDNVDKGKRGRGLTSSRVN